MIHYYSLLVAGLIMMGCEKQPPLESLEQTRYSSSETQISHPTTNQLEKPNAEEFYDAPKM